MVNTVEPRPVFGRCHCGRPIRREGQVECAEHDDPPPLPDRPRLPRVFAEPCSTCILRPGNPMHLRPGRLREVVTANLQAGALLTCHETTYEQRPDLGEVACRGYFDAYGDRTNVVRVMERLAALQGLDQWYEEVPPP